MTPKIETQRRGNYTAHPFVVPEIRNGAIVTEPEFIRLPRPKGRCPVSGLSRTTLAELVDSGAVKAAKLRKKGSLRAITLIHRESLLSYLRSQMRVESKPILTTPANIEGERPGNKEDRREASSGRVRKGKSGSDRERHQKSRRERATQPIQGRQEEESPRRAPTKGTAGSEDRLPVRYSLYGINARGLH